MPVPKPRAMTGGTRCFRCGTSPAVVYVAILTRPIVEGKMVSGNTTSRGHQFCAACADQVWDEMYERVEAKP